MLAKLVATVTLLSLLFFNDSSANDEILYDDDSEDSPLSQNCIRCLCKMMGCQTEGCVANACGVFRITSGYWQAAHYRNISTATTAEYEQCTTNVWCGMRTVQRYMRRYLPALQVQRPDRLRCENAVALHKFGSQRGHLTLTTRTRVKLFSCLSKNVFKWLDVIKP